MASKRARRRRACGHKQRHATLTAAMAHVMALRRAGESEVEPYRCPFGRHWHVGHRPQRRAGEE